MAGRAFCLLDKQILGSWNMELPSVGRSARFARSHTWEFLTPSSFCEVDTLASSLKCYHFRTCEGVTPPSIPLIALYRGITPTGFRHRPQGRFKPSGAYCPSVLISYHTPLKDCQGWRSHFFRLRKKQALDGLRGVIYRNHRRSKLPRGRAVGTSRHKGFRERSTLTSG